MKQEYSLNLLEISPLLPNCPASVKSNFLVEIPVSVFPLVFPRLLFFQSGRLNKLSLSREEEEERSLFAEEEKG